MLPLGSEVTGFGLGGFLQTVNFTLYCKRIVLTDVADVFPVTLVHYTGHTLPQPREVLGKSKPNGTEAVGVWGCYYLSLSFPSVSPPSPPPLNHHLWTSLVTQILSTIKGRLH